MKKADGGKPVFRIAGITCNPDILRFERRLEVTEARGDIMDKEITAFLDTQQAAVLKDNYERCWVEGQ